MQQSFSQSSRLTLVSEPSPQDMIALWSASADAWDKAVVEDVNRIGLLDARAMRLLGEVKGLRILDVGCGEGRLVRMLRARGAEPEGLDPVPRLIELARIRCPDAKWHLGRAEDLELSGFDWVVCYLSLIDVADLEQSVASCTRALKPGGRLLNITLSPFATTRTHAYETDPLTGVERIPMEDYMTPKAQRVGWKGIEIINFHRPLGQQLMAFVNQGLRLAWYEEAAPTDLETERYPKLAIQQSLPLFNLQVWEKPHATYAL